MAKPYRDAGTPDGFARLLNDLSTQVSRLQRAMPRQSATGAASAIAAATTHLTSDWDLATANGSYFSGTGAANGPNDADEFLGQVVSQGSGSPPLVIQRLSAYSPTGKPREYARTSFDDAGVIGWTPWARTNPVAGVASMTTDASGRVSLLHGFDPQLAPSAVLIGQATVSGFASASVGGGTSSTATITFYASGGGAIASSPVQFHWAALP